MEATKHSCKLIFIAILLILTAANVVFFFYIKNSAYLLSIQQKTLANSILLEQQRLSFIDAKFTAKYKYHQIHQLAKEKLQLEPLKVQRVKNLYDIISRNDNNHSDSNNSEQEQ